MPDLGKSESFSNAAVAAAGMMNISADGDQSGLKRLEPRSVSAVFTAPFLSGTTEPLTPVLRFVLQSDPPGSNYEFFASTEELASLASALLQNLAQSLEQRASLADKGVVKINVPTAVAEMVERMERSMQKVKEFAPRFGVVFENTSRSQEAS
jgi:hypothetical protein